MEKKIINQQLKEANINHYKLPSTQFLNRKGINLPKPTKNIKTSSIS